MQNPSLDVVVSFFQTYSQKGNESIYQKGPLVATVIPISLPTWLVEAPP